MFPGEKLDWEAHITNSPDGFAGNLVFQHMLPPGLAFRSVEAPAEWSCTTPRPGGSGAIRCTTSSLAPAEDARIVVRSHVTAGPDVLLESQISVVSNAIGSDPENNRALASNVVTRPGVLTDR